MEKYLARDKDGRLFLYDLPPQERNLLLKDLCARLPYDVCAHIRYKDGEPCYGKLTPRDIQWTIDSNIEVIKPYLRPMSSMTEEEEKEFEKIFELELKAIESPVGHTIESAASSAFEIDFYNKYHFDYRGLIEKGLALEAPEGMYNINNE